VEENEKNSEVIKQIKDIATNDNSEQLYIITSPLWEKKYKYDYEADVIVILSPKRKIVFLNLSDNDKEFNRYCNEFIEDLWSISDKFNYKDDLWRPWDWRNLLTNQEELYKKGIFNNKVIPIADILERNKVSWDLHRKVELLISLLIWSINDVKIKGVEEPDTLLEKVKKKIVLFDADQTRFIYEKKEQKVIHIQWLAGTWKTELLLHKLKDIYTSSEKSKIFFTCKNIALATELDSRIPDFFNFMKVEKQIEKNKRLWVNSAWGSNTDENSWLYRYICAYYKVPFLNLRQSWGSFDKAIKYTISEIEKIKNDESFTYALDYILVDESQDFPKSFFELCKTVTKEEVYVAWDLFQDIFDTYIDNREITPDYILNKCYRTDPRTLMFAQSIWMWLFEEPHLNWLSDDAWRDVWYIVKKEERDVYLSRYPIRRFEELDIDEYDSMKIKVIENDFVEDVILTIRELISENETITPSDIWVIYLDDDYNELCTFSTMLQFQLATDLEWEVNKWYLTKTKISDTVFVSNRNHVKGLEFPFVICVTNKIKNDYKYRNTLYTMLTRSFLQSFLLIKNDNGLQTHIDGLNIIKENNFIKTTQPTEDELSRINDTIINYKQRKQLSYRDFIKSILVELGIEKKLERSLTFLSASKFKSSFEYEGVKEFLSVNKDNF